MWGIFLSLLLNLLITVGIFWFLPQVSRFNRLVDEMNRALEPYRSLKQ
jgi:uncharacterized iron-regulated membrane protein